MTGWIRSTSCDTSACVEVWHKASRCVSSDCVEVAFRKASRSVGGNCVEVAFVKASASAGNGACVEVGRCNCDTPEVLVRDSKHPDGPRLSVTPAAFTTFLAGIRAGEFDLTG